MVDTWLCRKDVRLSRDLQIPETISKVNVLTLILVLSLGQTKLYLMNYHCHKTFILFACVYMVYYAVRIHVCMDLGTHLYTCVSRGLTLTLSVLDLFVLYYLPLTLELVGLLSQLALGTPCLCLCVLGLWSQHHGARPVQLFVMWVLGI